MGKVPLLIVDDDHLIPESSTIIEYLDELAEPKLAYGEAEPHVRVFMKEDAAA